MSKGIRHVSLCPCVLHVMLPLLNFLPTLPTPNCIVYVSQCTFCPTPKCSLSELNFTQEIVLTGNSPSCIEPGSNLTSSAVILGYFTFTQCILLQSLKIYEGLSLNLVRMFKSTLIPFNLSLPSNLCW